jgi:putative oxidoreductase
MMSAMFISGGINAMKNSSMLAKRAEPVTDRLEPIVERGTSALPFSVTPEQLVIANGAVHVVCGAMLATGRAPRLSALVLAASMVPTTLAGHRFWEESDPKLRATQRVQFLKNVSMTGGLLLASVDTEGKPSLAWQAKRHARHARDVVAEHASGLTPG